MLLLQDFHIAQQVIRVGRRIDIRRLVDGPIEEHSERKGGLDSGGGL